MFASGSSSFGNPLLDFVIKDWYISIPMLAMSITGITMVIWRILLNSKAKTDLNEFLPQFQEVLAKEGTEGALNFCKSRLDYIPRKLFVPGLETHKQGTAAMRRAMANSMELEIIPDLNILLPTILAIGKIATMVGLLGTVISMINTFNAIQQAKGGDVASQAGAIGLALFATALGLVTAIPLVFAYTLFKAWMAKFETTMKSAAHKFLILMQNVKAAPARPASAQAQAGQASGVASAKR